jgi:membrane-associated phospholipid phosphatase
MRLRWIAVAITVVGASSPAPAQSVGKMLKDDFSNAGKDVLGVWGAPFNASGRDWGTFAAAMGLFGVTMLVDEEVSEWAIRNDSAALFRAIEPLRRGGVLYTGKYVVPPVALLYIAGLVMKNQDMRDFVLGCAASWVAQSPPRRALAHAIGRARPDTTRDPTVAPHDAQIWKFGWTKDWNMRSFPGGHLANAMGCATFWNKRFDLGVAEPLLYGVAAAIGAGRLADRAHWLSDQVIGGILGYAIGAELARRSLDRRNEGAVPALNVSPGGTGTMLRFSWRF